MLAAKNLLLLGASLSTAAFAAETPFPTPPAASNQRHIVLIVWDGMRPDFVTEKYTPNLYQLARRGVTFTHHHPVYLSSTEVNGTAISTGSYPAHDGIIGNSEYRPSIDPSKPVHTEALETVRKGDALTHGHYIGLPTLAEIIRHAGRTTVVAGAKPVALLHDRAPRASLAEGANLFAGSTLPDSLLQTITNLHGPVPRDSATNFARNDWTTKAMLDPLWSNGVPDFSFLWMSQPDFSQHTTGPGSPESLAAIRDVDDNLARVLKAVDAKGVRDSTDVIIASDHGFSTVAGVVDLIEELRKNGLKATREFKTEPAPGEIMVVSNSGSSLLYVIGHDEKVIEQVVHFLQGWEVSGVIFTRQSMAGTFPLSQVHLDSEAAPDIVVSFRWSSDKSKTGVPGMLNCDSSGYGIGQGSHVSLSAFDMHNTLIAAGPDFRAGMINDLASGNVDIAPTILSILGIQPPKPMDGRVLTEALLANQTSLPASKSRHLEAAAVQGSIHWHQYLNLTEVNGVTYYDEGNGFQTRE